MSMLRVLDWRCAADGKTTLHALGSLEARGSLFAGVGTEVYAGMLIGECARENDLEVNPVREKKLSNVRASGADEKVSSVGTHRCNEYAVKVKRACAEDPSHDANTSSLY